MTADPLVDERRWTAIHEAAHAICDLLFGLPLKDASIVPEPGTLGRVTPKLVMEPEPRMHLVLGWEPRIRDRDHARIIALLAGDTAEELYKAEAGVFHRGYFPETPDYRDAMELARLSSESSMEEAWALYCWLRERTKNIVANLWFRRMVDAIVPTLLEKRDLSHAEIIELLRPIAADVLNIGPMTWQGRFRLRLRLASRPFRGAFRRLIRRYRWWRSRGDQ